MIKMKKRETRKGRVEEFRSLQIHFFLSLTMLRYVPLKCCDRLAGALSQSFDTVPCVLRIAFVVVVVSVPMQGILL